MQRYPQVWAGPRPSAWTRCHGTGISLSLLGLVAALVFVGPSFTLSSTTKAGSATARSATTPPPAAAGMAAVVTGSVPTTVPASTTVPAVAGRAGRGREFSPSVAGTSVGVDPDAGIPGLAPPSSIPDNCSVETSGMWQTWLATLAPGTLVRPPVGACYLVDRGITVRFPDALTIDGGTFENRTTGATFDGSGLGRATFDVLGGSHVTFEDLTIRGANRGGYHPALAFEAGIDLQGTADGVIRDVDIRHVYGDAITLDPLRGASDHMSGKILAPVSDLTVHSVTIDHPGRQGIALVSVDGADISDVALWNVGVDTFDVEADQANEGASDVTIDGCTSSSSNGGSFFANGGAGNGPDTHDITVENCQMLHPQGGDVVLVKNNATSPVPRGPITFTDDTLWCGVSVYVGCFQLNGADVSVTNSDIRFPHWRQRDHVYRAAGSNTASTISFTDDTVVGYVALGGSRPGSSAVISGGSWQSSGPVEALGGRRLRGSRRV